MTHIPASLRRKIRFFFVAGWPGFRFGVADSRDAVLVALIREHLKTGAAIARHVDDVDLSREFERAYGKLTQKHGTCLCPDGVGMHVHCPLCGAIRDHIHLADGKVIGCVNCKPKSRCARCDKNGELITSDSAASRK